MIAVFPRKVMSGWQLLRKQIKTAGKTRKRHRWKGNPHVLLMGSKPCNSECRFHKTLQRGTSHDPALQLLGPHPRIPRQHHRDTCTSVFTQQWTKLG